MPTTKVKSVTSTIPAVQSPGLQSPAVQSPQSPQSLQSRSLGNSTESRSIEPVLAPSTHRAISSLESMWEQVNSARQKIRGECLTERPADSFTLEEYSVKFGICRNTAVHQLRRLIESGTLVAAKALIMDSIGRMVTHNIYIVQTSSKPNSRGLNAVNSGT